MFRSISVGLLASTLGSALVASALLACSKNEPAVPSSCISLAGCCAELMPADQGSCTSIAASGNEAACSATASGLLGMCPAVISDPAPPVRDGGGDLQDGDAGPGFALDATSLDAGLAPGPSCAAPAVDAGADCLKCRNNCETSRDYLAACEAYDACYCPCDPNDKSCQQACAPLIGECEDIASEVASCIVDDCSDLCAPAGDSPCARLVACCDKEVDSGVLGAADAGLCSTMVANLEANGGAAACAAQLDGGVFGQFCQ